MTDHFQLTAIIAAAIRDCRPEKREDAPQHPDTMEEAHCVAKAVLAAIAEAGFEISPKRTA
jgi:hypothetical protein